MEIIIRITESEMEALQAALRVADVPRTAKYLRASFESAYPFMQRAAEKIEEAKRTDKEEQMKINRNLKIEDAVSPMVERAKIAFLTFDERMERHYQKWNGHAPYAEQKFPVERLDEYSAVLNDGHPKRAEIKRVFRGLGLGKITHDELRAVIIRMFLRDTPEHAEAEFENLGQFQKLARIVSSWIMDAFDDACWMTEDEAEDWLASTRPHSIAG